MKPGEHSRTAEAAAAARAWHMHATEHPVFEDPWALSLLSPGYRRRVTSPILRRLQTMVMGSLAPMAIGQVVLRSRYTEDALADAVGDGVEQYVVLGAGLDTFALRRPESMETLRVFEVDHPDTQAFKRARLEALGVAVPDGLEFAPVDFAREGVGAGLARTSYRGDRRSFFSWLGTVPYLASDAIVSTLRALTELSPVGSELVFDFAGSIEDLPRGERRALDRLQRFATRRGEPFQTWGAPEPFLAKVCALGYERVELLDPKAQERRYLADGRLGLRSLPAAYLVRLRRV